MDARDLSALHPTYYAGQFLSAQEILSWFTAADAYWGYAGDASPEKPHAELTSGLCSNGYFDCPRLFSHPNITEILAVQLATSFRGLGRVDWVVSSAYSAITFGHEVAKALGAQFMNVEKDPSDPEGKRMVWRRITIPKDSLVLQVEELITTLGTTREVRRVVQEENSEPITFSSIIGVLVHRPPKFPVNYGNLAVIPLVEKEVWVIPSQDCPLCAVGSPRYKPKTHWLQLTGK